MLLSYRYARGADEEVKGLCHVGGVHVIMIRILQLGVAILHGGQEVVQFFQINAKFLHDSVATK